MVGWYLEGNVTGPTKGWALRRKRQAGSGPIINTGSCAGAGVGSNSCCLSDGALLLWATYLHGVFSFLWPRADINCCTVPPLSTILVAAVLLQQWLEYSFQFGLPNFLTHSCAQPPKLFVPQFWKHTSFSFLVLLAFFKKRGRVCVWLWWPHINGYTTY